MTKLFSIIILLVLSCWPGGATAQTISSLPNTNSAKAGDLFYLVVTNGGSNFSYNVRFDQLLRNLQTNGLASTTNSFSNQLVWADANGVLRGVTNLSGLTFTNGTLSNTVSSASSITPLAFTLTTISNSTVETDVLSVTITNNTFTTGKTVRVKLWGDFIKNTGGTENTTNMVKLGTTYIYKDSIGNMVNSANNRAPMVEIDLYAVSNTSQSMRMFTVYGTGGAADIGEGDGAQSSVQRINTYAGTAAEDMTSGNKIFTFTVNFSGANTALYWRPVQAVVEMINAP